MVDSADEFFKQTIFRKYDKQTTELICFANAKRHV